MFVHFRTESAPAVGKLELLAFVIISSLAGLGPFQGVRQVKQC
jgi:hypothetical protein